MTDLRNRLEIPAERLDEINAVLLNPDMRVINDFLDVVAKYGTPEEINAKARESRKLENLLARVKSTKPDYLLDLEWLAEQRDIGAFISISDYRRKVLGDVADTMVFSDDFAVTLEISALQYFPWIRMIAERALKRGMLMPGRFIRVRKMKEQVEDGDISAVAAAMQIVGATYVETLDTKGTGNHNRLFRRGGTA
jgi:hypothetical protein